MYFHIQPDVAGNSFGDNSIIDVTVHPPVVTRLHYVFDGWSGDDLVESFPCFLVTKWLAKELENEGLSGFSLDDVEVSKSETFLELYPDVVLPKFFWLKISGAAGIDDFGFVSGTGKGCLVVSKKALDVLCRGKIDLEDLENYHPVI